MSYTEQDVERVVEAIEHAISNIDSRVIDDIDMSLVDNPWGMIARAALEAMEREPLEEVLEGAGVTRLSIEITPAMNGHGRRVLARYLAGFASPQLGRGATIDEAIRAAVERAKGGE